MAETLALLSALCFGLTHFVSGVLSRSWNGVTVAGVAQVGGTALSVVIAVCVPAGQPALAPLLWGVLSGVGTGVGVAYLYRAMSRGPMSVVAPVSDVAGLALPVLVGVLLLGERPSAAAYAGSAVAVVAIWLVSRGQPADGVGAGPAGGGRRGRRMVAGVPDALVAGLGIAAHFVAVARIPPEAGMWPIVLSRGVSVVVIVALAAALGAPLRLPRKATWAALAAGGVGTVATILYWVAVNQGLLATTTVLAAMYPAIPVVLAIAFLRERLVRSQVLGLLGAGVAIALVSA
ncbi:EamA family transporter [Promicromonospora sukumoe]|uniref:EamA family transporter n=1 Tax=Promicromonospora sukumoe TaxID=88382 RepID=UPI0003739D44|nr:EamA family transporter [Promicromonospora sukumoe]